MRGATIIALLCLAAALCACRTPERPIQPLARPQPTNELRSVDRFAFGGVGIAGVPSQGELAFREMLARTNALPCFEGILTSGTTEAKLYALCGIRRLSPQELSRHAQIIASSDLMVTTMSGCIVESERAATVVNRIRTGSYDHYMNPKNQ